MSFAAKNMIFLHDSSGTPDKIAQIIEFTLRPLGVSGVSFDGF